MDAGQRTILGMVWMGVAFLTLSAMDPWSATLWTAVGWFVVTLGLLLAVLYTFNPLYLLDRYHP